jgi:hypothetical protein
MFLTKLVFITVIYLLSNFFCCFGLPWLPNVGGHFWPFTGVQNGNQWEVMRKVVGGFCVLVAAVADRGSISIL